MSREKSNDEYWMVAILCAAFGVLSVEIFVTGYLAPFIGRDLGLSNARIGVLLSGFWVTYSIGSYLAGLLTDAWGRRKPALVLLLLLASACSVLSGFARSFPELLAARLLMGLLIGPFLPIAQTLIALQAPRSRLGLYTGLLQSLGNNILAVFVAPTVVVYLAVHHGWRAGFFVVILPGLLCAALVAWLIREPGEGRAARPSGTEPRSSDPGQIRDPHLQPARRMARLLGNANFWICAAGAALLVSYITVTLGFLPLLLVVGRGFTPERMSELMSVLGVAGAVLGVGLPAVSDHLGRRPVMVIACALGVVGSAAALFYTGPLVICAALLFVGWAAAGACPLFVALVPSESVPKDLISTAIGVNLALATLVGGMAGPALAGWAADVWGPRAPVYICLACAGSAAVLGLLVRETAPRRIGHRLPLAAPR
jgi:ACS family hexuronate transporter-like MFS transporter